MAAGERLCRSTVKLRKFCGAASFEPASASVVRQQEGEEEAAGGIALDWRSPGGGIFQPG
jgi:hypothetical protein